MGIQKKMCWNEERQKVFDALKGWLIRKPVLEIYQLDKHHVMQTDASDKQISAVLSLQMTDVCIQ